jgi:hypothetical protein
VVDSADRGLAVLAPNDWETRFFGRRIGSLTLDTAALSRAPAEAAAQAIALAGQAADAAGYTIVQARLEVGALQLAAALEQAGFRLADTRVEFLTRLDRRTAPRHLPPFGSVAFAGLEHRDALLALVHEGLVANPQFQSRYKDPAYFTPEETRRWFTAWVDSDLADPQALVATWEVEGAAAAFFGCTRRGEKSGLPLYKSTLAVTAPGWRGHKAHMFLQTALFAALPQDGFWMQSVTQIGNGPIIRNNFALGRRLERVDLVFFRRGPVVAP